MMNEFHQPVLLKETKELLNIKSGEKYIDATVGGGGHSLEILKLGGKVLGLDCDPEAIKAAGRYLSSACPAPDHARKRLGAGPNTSWQLAQGNFARLKKIAQNKGFTRVAGIFFDLGVSSYQLETPQRGFSFKSQAELDMRMDPGLKVTAADLVNGLNKGELDELFYKLGEEHCSRHVAESICRARRIAPIKTCSQLAQIIAKAKPKGSFAERIDPATRCFQALRIAVNDELNNLKQGLPQALDLLKRNGRLAVISFHSGEDRIVKNFFREMEAQEKVEIITKKPIMAGESEKVINPRSRSAKLRVVEKKCQK